MTDFSKAYSAEWHLYRVDADTWADAEEIGGMLEASISRDTQGDAPEVESGTLTMLAAAAAEWEPGYYRIAMRAIQGGVERVDVATLLCESSGGTTDYGVDELNVTGRSVLHPAAVCHVALGESALAKSDGAAKCAEMLRGCIQAPVEVDGGFKLSDHYDFAPGTSVLAAVWTLLKAGGFCMYPDGRGTVHIEPMPDSAVLPLDRANASLLDSSIDHALDYSNVPNRYTAVDGGVAAVAENDSAGSPTSHAVRGYWHDAYDASPARLDNETLLEYARRKLEEASVVEDARTYTRRYVPNVHPFSIVRGSMPSVGLNGDMRVKSQTIDCSHGITVTETAAKEVATWTR